MNLPLWARSAVVAGLLLLAACEHARDSAETNDATTPVAAGPREHVLATHDTLMLRMGPLNKERQRLRARLQQLSTAAADTATATSRTARRQLRDRLAQVQAADDAMMDWMHAYREPDTANLSAAQQSTFWAHQTRLLAGVDSMMTSALDAARQTP